MIMKKILLATIMLVLFIPLMVTKYLHEFFAWLYYLAEKSEMKLFGEENLNQKEGE